MAEIPQLPPGATSISRACSCRTRGSAIERLRYPEAMFIEPETLYRGVLYGSAYSILGLTSGARFYELAQISLDRFEEPRPYKLLRDKQPTGKLGPDLPPAAVTKGMHPGERATALQR